MKGDHTLSHPSEFLCFLNDLSMANDKIFFLRSTHLGHLCRSCFGLAIFYIKHWRYEPRFYSFSLYICSVQSSFRCLSPSGHLKINLLGQGGILLKLSSGVLLRCSRLLNQQSNLSSHILVLRAHFQWNYFKLSYLHTAFAIILIWQTFQELSPKILPSKSLMLPVTQIRCKAADLVLVVKFRQY